jgi:cbb3-type cytochrome oxidase subunit 3
MKLSDVMSAADLAIFAEAALLLFFGVFLLVLVRAAWPGRGDTWSELGRLPLEDDQTDGAGANECRAVDAKGGAR